MRRYIIPQHHWIINNIIYYPCILFLIIASSDTRSIIDNGGGGRVTTAASAFYFFLNYHNIPKCTTVDVPQDTEISIHYKFPDVVLFRSVPVNYVDVRPNTEKIGEQTLPKYTPQHLDNVAVGVDIMWSRRQQQQRYGILEGEPLLVVGTQQEKEFYDGQRRRGRRNNDLNTIWERHRDMNLQRHKLDSVTSDIHTLSVEGKEEEEESDISILVYQTSTAATIQKLSSISTDTKDQKSRPYRHGIERFYVQDTGGVITYKTKVSGSVYICIQSKKASPQYPSRAGIHVQYDLHQQQRQVWSSLTDTLTSIRRNQVQTMLNEADYAKTLEVNFHTQSLHLYAASTQYSLVRILCLLLIGFVQLQFLLHFFHKKHIL